MLAVVVALFLAVGPAPLVPERLAWELTVDQAREALARAGWSPRDAETRGYFGRSPATHTTEPGLFFTPRVGWSGEAKFRWSQADRRYRLESVTLDASLSPEALAAELAALVRRFGPPTQVAGLQRIWVRGGIRLVAIPSAPRQADKPRPFHVVYRRE